MRFVKDGYAVVVQDTRGRYDSEGAWNPFQNEANDSYDTIEWAARQTWANGKVGMHGGSYLGPVQWQAATMAPPHLTAIFPVLASTGIPHNTFFHGGAFKLALGRRADAESHHESAVLAHGGLRAAGVEV